MSSPKLEYRCVIGGEEVTIVSEVEMADAPPAGTVAVKLHTVEVRLPDGSLYASRKEGSLS